MRRLPILIVDDDTDRYLLVRDRSCLPRHQHASGRRAGFPRVVRPAPGGADEVREECVATMVSSSEDPEERARAMGDDFVGGFITKKAHDS